MTTLFQYFKLKEDDNKSPFKNFNLKRGTLPNLKPRKASIDVEILRKTSFGKDKGQKGTAIKGLYNISKQHLTMKQLNDLRQELTMTPKQSSVGGAAKVYALYSENDTWFRMPRFYGISKFGWPERTLLTDGEPMSAIVSNTAPRKYQETPINTVVQIMQEGTPGAGALIEADCGTGKTFLGIEIARRLGRRTAVIVNKGDLQTQFMERIHQYCPSATVGIVRRDKVEVNNDFVIFMAQSISAGKYGPEVFSSFGLVIVDEAHHWVAETLNKTLSKFSSRCILGLTATPDRKDQLGYALPYFFGPTVVKMKREGQAVEVQVVKIVHGTAREIVGRTGKPILAKTITMMTQDEERNIRIVNIILKERKKGRYVIALGARRTHLLVLKDLLEDKTTDPVGLYVGETSKKRIAIREAGKNSPILLCTNKMAEEGLDIPRLDCLVFLTPKSNIQQAVGRIQRTHPDKKKSPKVIDLYDTYCGGALHGMYRARKSFYERHKFTFI